MKRIIFFVAVSIFMISSNGFAKSCSLKNSFEWERVAPSEVGIDQSVVEKFTREITDSKVTSSIIVRSNRIVNEYYKNGYNATSLFPMHSVSKSVTSAIVGIAIDQGYFNLDDPIVKFFPQLENKRDSRFKKITIRDLLINKSGLISTDTPQIWKKWRASDNWINFLFDRPLTFEPGKVFQYSTGNTHLLSAIIRQTTGKTLKEYGNEVLFKPIGMASANFDVAPNGICDAGNGLNLTARDMARFGLLYLHSGVWCESQVVPLNWVSESVKIQTPGQARYGYQWWIRYFGKEQLFGFFAHGWQEQVIAVIPQKGLVITFSSNYPDNSKNATYWRWISMIVDGTT